MLAQFIRWFRGYLKINIIGYSPERFLNICKNKNIRVWELKSTNDFYSMCVYLGDFKMLKPLCKKTGCKVRIAEKKGLPFVVSSMNKRKSFVFGFLLSVAILFITSMFVWEIKLAGNQKLTYDVIRSYLTDNNINIGTALNKINCKNLASDIRKEFEDIVWVSVSVEGTNLMIEIRENTDSVSAKESDATPMDIIAKYDGIITDIVTRSGIPMIKKGDTVQKGDILVSGCIPIMNDNKEVVGNRYVKADADIIGETTMSYQDTINNIFQKKEYINESLYWEIGPIKKSIKNKKHLEIFIEDNWINLGTIKKYKLVEMKYSEKERESILKNNYHKYVQELIEPNGMLLDSNIVITHYETHSIATGHLRIKQPMEESRKIIDLSSENMLQ